MTLSVRNSTPNTVYVAVGYPNDGCSPRIAKRGWYEIRPGRTRAIFGGNANNTFYWYAEDNAGHVWSGNEYTDVPEEAFHMCWIAACKPCRRLGFRAIGFFGGSSDRIINLVLSSSRRTVKSPLVRNALPSKRKLKRTYAHGRISLAKRPPLSRPGQ